MFRKMYNIEVFNDKSLDPEQVKSRAEWHKPIISAMGKVKQKPLVQGSRISNSRPTWAR